MRNLCPLHNLADPVSLHLSRCLVLAQFNIHSEPRESDLLAEVIPFACLTAAYSTRA